MIAAVTSARLPVIFRLLSAAGAVCRNETGARGHSPCSIWELMVPQAVGRRQRVSSWCGAEFLGLNGDAHKKKALLWNPILLLPHWLA